MISTTSFISQQIKTARYESPENNINKPENFLVKPTIIPNLEQSPQSVKSSPKIKLGYAVSKYFTDHHILDTGKIVTNRIPDKPRPHIKSFSLSKSPIRKHHYEDGRTLNENRFENINKLPNILSKSKNIPTVNFSKNSPRKTPPKEIIPIGYNPNFKHILAKNSQSIFTGFVKKLDIKFDEIVGRIPRNSIYKFDNPPEVKNYEMVINGYARLSKQRKSADFNMNKTSGRDEKMYRIYENYRPESIEIEDAIKQLLGEIEYSKKHKEKPIVN